MRYMRDEQKMNKSTEIKAPMNLRIALNASLPGLGLPETVILGQ